MIFRFSLLSSRKTLREFLSYTLIGLLTNVLGFSLYLLLTYSWGSPKLTMTVLYLVGASISFFANRRFTFFHDGHIGVAGIHYILAQIAGYLINLGLLVLFVDWLHFPHQIVQAASIGIVAIFLFLMLRFFVFPHTLSVTKESEQ
jgi:putative flippase GtrA